MPNYPIPGFGGLRTGAVDDTVLDQVQRGPEPVADEATARMWGEVARAGQQAQNVGDKMIVQQQASYLANQQAAIRDHVSQMEVQYANDPQGFANAQTGYRAGVLDQAPGHLAPYLNKIMASEFDSAGARIALRAKNKAFIQGKQAFSASLDQAQNGLLNFAGSGAALNTPEAAAKFAAVGSQIDAGVTSGYYTPEEAQVLKTNLHERAIAASLLPESTKIYMDAYRKTGNRADALAALDKGAQELTTGNPALKDLSPDVLQRMGQQFITHGLQADRLVRAQQVQQRAFVRQAYENNLASISTTGKPVAALSDKQIMDVAGPVEGPAMIKALTDAQTYHTAVTASALTSPAQDAELLQKLAPQGADFAQGARYQGAFRAALARKYTEIKKDPAAYVMQIDPQVHALYQAAMQNPAEFPSAVAALDSAYDQLDVPAGNRPIMPKTAATSLVQSVLSQPPEQRAQFFTKMASQYGAMWPRVLGDLTKNGLPAIYNVMAAVGDAGARTMLANVIGTGKHPIRSAVPPEEAKSIDHAIENSSAMQSLRNSFGYASGGAQLFNSIQSAVKMMAYGFSFQMDPTDAVNRAVASVTSEKYDLGTIPGARLPAGDGSEIASAATSLLASLQPSQLAIPANPSHVKLTAAQLQNVALSAVRRGRWVTNEADNGLVRLDVNGQPVMLANGKRLELPFSAVKLGDATAVPWNGSADWTSAGGGL